MAKTKSVAIKINNIEVNYDDIQVVYPKAKDKKSRIARVYLPKSWIGCKVLAIRVVDEKEGDSNGF